jgi:hypothetical protein
VAQRFKPRIVGRYTLSAQLNHLWTIEMTGMAFMGYYVVIKVEAGKSVPLVETSIRCGVNAVVQRCVPLR